MNASARQSQPGNAQRCAALLVLAAVALSGCAPARLLPIPPGWPHEIEGRTLYHTPRGFIYATSAASAGWMDRYLLKRLPSIEEQFDVKLSTGVVIVIGPGDAPMPDIRGWPPWPVKNLMHVWYPPISADDFGLPESRWVCPLPTDSYYHRAVDDYHWKILTAPCRKPAALVSGLTSWPFLFLLPRQRARYVGLSDMERERALATAAIEFCDLSDAEKQATMHRLAEFYDGRERAVRDKYGIRD